jgi:predicted RNA-binding Zn-ribbon protein involved in translation (DUF1610 family)
MTSILNSSYQKYGKDAPFEDPVVRCDSCQAMIFREKLKELGRCPKCGRKKVRNCDVFSEEEFALMKEKGVDPQFLALFEGIDDE